jgi:putative transcriptional regulator
VAPDATPGDDEADIGPVSQCGSKSGGKKRGKSRLPRSAAPADSSGSQASEAPDQASPKSSENESTDTSSNAGVVLGGLISSSGEVYGPVAAQAGSAIVHFGGPMSGPVVAVHGTRALAEAEAGQGVFMAAQREHLEELVKRGEGDFRLIIGHSAWTSAQLSEEFSAGYWHVLPATQETALPVRVDLWPHLIRRATGASVASWVGARDNGGWTGLN